MEGRIGSVLAEVQIPYRPQLTKITNRVTATVLLQQVIYYWEHSGCKPFYKFRAPCTHDRYRDGDSWTEYLAFSPAEFDTALKTIGTKITKGDSKTDALAGKGVNSLVLYWTDSNRMTWYELNEELLEELLSDAYSDANSGKCNYHSGSESESSRESWNPELHSSKTTTKTTQNNAASPQPPLQIDGDYLKEIYFRDKAVNRLGTVRAGPWEVECDACGGGVYIPKLDKQFECLCGNRAFILLSKKPHKPTKERKPEAVEAYYAIVRSRGVRHGANEEFETDIAAAVTDLTRWRQVVKEYIHPDFGGNPYGVDKMLVYYNENRLPGSRKQKERDALPPTFHDIPPLPDEPDAKPPTEPIPGYEEMKQQMLRMRRGDA